MNDTNLRLQTKRNFKLKNRIHTRYKYSDIIKIENISLEKVDLRAVSRDISCDGIGFLSNRCLEVKDILRICFKYNNVTIPALV